MEGPIHVWASKPGFTKTVKSMDEAFLARIGTGICIGCRRNTSKGPESGKNPACLKNHIAWGMVRVES